MIREQLKRSKIKLIAAMGKNRELGVKNGLPAWNLASDMLRFKTLTNGKIVVMGQNTYLSLPEKWRPLPNRRNVVLTLDKDFTKNNVEVFHSIPELLEYFKDEEEIWIMGGGMIYKQFVELADELHLTFVDGEFPADIYFPEFDQENKEKYKITHTEKISKDEKNSHDTEYVVFEKIV